MQVPFHYRDNGQPCPTSGTPGWREGETCRNGCEGSRFHYANDGHAACLDRPCAASPAGSPNPSAPAGAATTRRPA